MQRQTITPELRAIAAGIAVAHPLRNAAVAINRGPAETTTASHTFDAAIEAIDAGADRVDAQRIQTDSAARRERLEAEANLREIEQLVREGKLK